jgi:hypothetical protein
MAAELYVCHDLKSPRGEVSQGLPPVYRLVPIGFYLALVGSTFAMCWFEMERRKAVVEGLAHATQAATYQAETARIGGDRARIDALVIRATGVAKWLDGAVGLQPICVAVSRGAGKHANIIDLSLTRNSELPEQVKLELRMSNANSEVMDATLQGIRDLGVRAYSAQQSTELDQLDYKATLVWQKSSGQGRQGGDN